MIAWLADSAFIFLPVSNVSMGPNEFCIDSALDLNRRWWIDSKFGVMRLKEILAGHGEIETLCWFPSNSRIGGDVGPDGLCGQRIDVAEGLIEFEVALEG